MSKTSKKNECTHTMHNVKCCAICQTPKPDKGRAMDGGRAYRCKNCGNIWTEGMQGCKKKYSEQRDGYQFVDSRRHPL